MEPSPRFGAPYLVLDKAQIPTGVVEVDQPIENIWSPSSVEVWFHSGMSRSGTPYNAQDSPQRSLPSQPRTTISPFHSEVGLSSEYASSVEAAESIGSSSPPCFSASSTVQSPSMRKMMPMERSLCRDSMPLHPSRCQIYAPGSSPWPDQYYPGACTSAALYEGPHCIERPRKTPLPVSTGAAHATWAASTIWEPSGYSVKAWVSAHAPKGELSGAVVHYPQPSATEATISGTRSDSCQPLVLNPWPTSKTQGDQAPENSVDRLQDSLLPPFDDDIEATEDDEVALGYDDESEIALGRQCINSRNHPLFELTPDENGLYHCPFAVKGRCGHDPVKLPCNHAKMVEAHIKQYRCTKSEACKTPMTSRAIRFRHQREQHEGSRHRCLEPGCPRSTTSLFPRAYNRDDHMKRTHGWAPNSPAKKRQPIARVQRQKKHKDQKASLQRRMDRADEVDSVEATFTEANAATESLTKHSALTDQHASSGAHVSSALFMAKAESTLDDFRSAEYQWNQQRNLVHSMTHVNSVCDRDGVVRLLDEASTFKQMTFEIHARFPNLGSVAYPPLWF